MFVTKSQFFVFIACVAFGSGIGFLLSILSAIKFFIKYNVVKIFIDVVLFSIVSVLYSHYTYTLGFPNLRMYMLLGVFIGMALYLKSLHILLANYIKKFYNIIVKNYKKRKIIKNDRSKVKKDNSGNHGGRSPAIDSTAIHNGLSTDIHKSSKRQRRIFGAKNSRI